MCVCLFVRVFCIIYSELSTINVLYLTSCFHDYFSVIEEGKYSLTFSSSSSSSSSYYHLHVLVTQDLSRCLEAEDDTEVCAHFLTSDHMFDKVPPNEINKSLTKLKDWWRHLTVRHGRDLSMTADVYKTLIAR